MDNIYTRDTIIIKLGGCSITKKDCICTVNYNAINDMINAINFIYKQGIDIIIVHGAGSFGHLKAKSWDLANGKQDNFIVDKTLNTFGLLSQKDAIISVQNDMKELNNIIKTALENKGLKVQTHETNKIFTDTGISFKGDITSTFIGRYNRIIDIIYGDVVYCNNDKEFGILSGDDIIYRLATELSNIKLVIFTLNDVDGLLKYPPDSNKPQELIPIWKEGDKFIGKHYTSQDVTGGIFLKVLRASEIAKKGINVILIRGLYDRVINACLGNPFIGTRIIA